MKSFAARAFRVTVDEQGLQSVGPTSGAGAVDPEQRYLDRLVIGGLRRDGTPVTGAAEPMVIDADEAEQRWVAPGQAAIETRHTFVGGWRTRVVLTNLSDESWTAALRFSVRPGPGYRCWRLVAGPRSVLALLPTRTDTAILYARSAGGPAMVTPAADDPAAFDIGPYRLAPGERVVLAWDWATARQPRRLAAMLPPLPRWPVVAVGEEIWLPADPDTALAGADELEVTDLGDRRAVTAAEPGRHRVELRSAQGSTVLDLSWVPTVADHLTSTAELVLAAPPGPAGVVRLPDLASALVVQRVARTAGFAAAPEAADALDQFTARLDDDGPDAALRAVYLAGEYDRLGDPDLVTRSARLIDRVPAAVPGLGLAVMRTAVAAVLAGRSASLDPSRRSVPAGPDDGTSGDADAMAAAELRLATRPPEQLSGDEVVAGALRRIGVLLLAGLPGRLPADQPLEQWGHAVAVARLVPEDLGGWWRGRYGVSLGELADARSLELVERLQGGGVSAAHAWLALSS